MARNNKIDFLGFFYLVIENIKKFKKLKIFTFDLSYNQICDGFYYKNDFYG